MNPQTKVQISGLSVFYGAECVLKNIRLEILAHEILGIIGPASSGKTSLRATR